MKTTLQYSFILVLLIGALPVLGQDIDTTLPDIPAGQAVTITYQVAVNDVLTPNISYVSNQGTVTGSNFSPVVTNDPATVQDSDETLTPLRFNLAVNELPRTGQSPWWRLPLVLIGIMGATIMLLLGWRSTKTQAAQG